MNGIFRFLGRVVKAAAPVLIEAAVRELTKPKAAEQDQPKA